MFSICTIVKNEEKNISKFIESALNTSLLDFSCELVLVDTGSSDDTVQIISEYVRGNSAIRFFEYAWSDDFSAAKNFAASKAKNEMILSLDCDEFLEMDKNDLKAAISEIDSKRNQVGRIELTNVYTQNSEQLENIEWHSRIYSKNLFEYRGAIHEQICSKDNSKPETYKSSIKVYHTGYDLTDEEKKAKSQRNTKLLLKELQRLKAAVGYKDLADLEGVNPEGNSDMEQIPYVLYQLGMSAFMIKDYESAIDWFEKGLCFDLNPKLEYVQGMVENYGYSLLNGGQAEKALGLTSLDDVFGKTADFKILLGHIYMNNLLFDQAIEAFDQARQFKTSKVVGANSFLAYYNMGVVFECRGMIDKAKECYSKCGEYKKAVERLKEIEK